MCILYNTEKCLDVTFHEWNKNHIKISMLNFNFLLLLAYCYLFSVLFLSSR